MSAELRALIADMVGQGYIKEVQHPSLPLTLYNYTPKAQYEKVWNDATLACRGLVFDANDRVAMRPFRKFFNDTEMDVVPWDMPHEVTAKMDGSLLIVADYESEMVCATRGSFTSPQAAEGAAILERKYPWFRPTKGITYCFEVIYPENRIVVDYGKTRTVVLLAMFETFTGNEIPLDLAPQGLNIVERMPWTAYEGELRKIIKDNEEGYVVRFADGTRIKVKGERYCELHRIITGCSSRTIWEYLKDGKDIEELLERTPDEFNKFVRGERWRLEDSFESMYRLVGIAVDSLQKCASRKAQAEALRESEPWLRASVFNALDGKDYDHIIWKALYPPHRQPFLDRVNADA